MCSCMHWNYACFLFHQSFRDKAVETELKNAVIRCLNPGCPWEGEGRHFKVSFA